MALVAATVAWLKQRTGRVDFVIACPVTGRWPSSTQDAFGLFAYPLPVRIDASGEIDFDMLLRRVRLSMLAAYQHQQAPFSRILAAVSQKGVSRNALTEVICNLIPATEWGAAIEIHRGTSDFDLDIAWIERSESLQLAISTTAGLLNKFSFRVNSFRNCFSVCNLRFTNICFNFEFSSHPVNKNFKMKFSHSAN